MLRPLQDLAPPFRLRGIFVDIGAIVCVLRGLLQVAAALPCFQPAFSGLQLGKRACQITIGPCHFHHTSYLVLLCLL